MNCDRPLASRELPARHFYFVWYAGKHCIYFTLFPPGLLYPDIHFHKLIVSNILTIFSKKNRKIYDSYYINDTIEAKSGKTYEFWVNDDTKKASCSIIKVWFSDGTTWTP
jgi:hypothetical protein